jgi:hypothetical protein
MTATAATCDLGDIFAQLLAPARPPLPLLAWADRLRIVDDASGTQHDRHPQPLVLDPGQRAIVAAIGDARWPRVVVAGPVQWGKSLACCAIPIAHSLAESRQPCMIAGPRESTAVGVWRDKTRTLLIDSDLASVLPADGAGSKAGTPDSILATTGARLFLRGAGGTNEAQQASDTARLVVITEVDSIAISARRAKRVAGEGDQARRRINLFANRTASYGEHGKVVLESTVKDDRASLILALWSEGTAGRLWHPCPHCAGWSPREWSQVSYDHDDPAGSVRLACGACGTLLTADQATAAAERAVDVHRGQRIDAGQVVGPMPPCTVWSLRLTSLDTPRRSLAWLAREHRDAIDARDNRQDHEPLKQFVRDHLVAGYQADDAVDRRRQVGPAVVATGSAASAYAKGTAPWAGVGSMGIDWQEREAWWLGLVAQGDRAAIVDWGVEYLCHRHEQPTPQQRRAALDRLKARAAAGWPSPDGQVACTGRIMDLGGRGWLETLEIWMREERWSWWGARGDSRREGGEGEGIYRAPGWYERFDRADGRRLLLCDPAGKGRLLAGLAAPPDSPVALLVPQGIAGTDHLARLLTAEHAELGADGVWRWVVDYHHNHLMDCGLYAWAMARYQIDHPLRAPTTTAAPGGIAWVGGRR